MFPEIKEGAIFIADAHENAKRKYFKKFLDDLKSDKIKKPPQLFLMGDIFDILIGEVTYSTKLAKYYIEELEELANSIEIYFFEGNHDFNLTKLFKKVKVIPINLQPMSFQSPFGIVLLSHGDKFSNIFYKFYSIFIRNKYILSILNLLDIMFKFKISKKIYKILEKKKICKNIKNFKNIIEKKLRLYKLKNVYMVVEGHYHQDKNFHFNNLEYINLNSFACNQSYFLVQFQKRIKFTRKSARGN